jgi:hypothetical protein
LGRVSTRWGNQEKFIEGYLSQTELKKLIERVCRCRVSIKFAITYPDGREINRA